MTIFLCGFMGCGKSTIGKRLAAQCGVPFTDMDDYIEEQAGLTIPQIFEQFGETHFRDLETQAVRELASREGVIACGGGVVTREENYYSLAENGRFVFIHRDIETLPTEGRPLSQSTPLARMYAQRLPLYRSWCDLEVENKDRTIEEIAEEIIAAI